MSGATIVTPNHFIASLDSLNTNLGSIGPLDVSEVSSWYQIPSISAVKTMLAAPRANPLIILDSLEATTASKTHRFEISHGVFKQSTAVYVGIGQVRLDDTTKDGIILIFAPLSTARLIRQYLIGQFPDLEMIAADGDIDTDPVVKTMIDITLIRKAEYSAYRIPESKLIARLMDTTIPLGDRILTALLNMYPYIEKRLLKTVSVFHEEADALPVGNTWIDNLVGSKEARPGETLALFVVMILGHAYSRQDMMNAQLAKRAKAIATVLKSDIPDEALVSNVLSAVGWQIDGVPPIVDDALGLVLCRRTDGTTDCEASFNDLVSPSKLKDDGLIGSVGAVILDQARLVYHNFHASSINFIVPLLPALHNGLGSTYLSYNEEVSRFQDIIEIIKSSPYTGLRSQIPEKFHLKKYPLLVKTAVEYHKRSLTDDAEKKLFEQYKVGDLKNFTDNKSAYDNIDSVVESLAPPQIRSLAELIAILPLNKAKVIISRKPKEVVMEIMHELRHRANPGAWMTHVIDTENGELQRLMLVQGSEKLKKMLSDTYDSYKDQADAIMDPELKRNSLEKLKSWRDSIRQGIEDLTPFSEYLPQATHEGQKKIREDTLVILEDILKRIRQPIG